MGWHRVILETCLCIIAVTVFFLGLWVQEVRGLLRQIAECTCSSAMTSVPPTERYREDTHLLSTFYVVKGKAGTTIPWSTLQSTTCEVWSSRCQGSTRGASPLPYSGNRTSDTR